MTNDTESGMVINMANAISRVMYNEIERFFDLAGAYTGFIKGGFHQLAAYKHAKHALSRGVWGHAPPGNF